MSSVLGEAHPETVGLRSTLATVYEAEGRLEEAEAEWREALAGHRSLLGEAHGMVATHRIALACVLLKRGRREEALGLLRENVAHAHSPVPTGKGCGEFREDPEIAALARELPPEPASE